NESPPRTWGRSALLAAGGSGGDAASSAEGSTGPPAPAWGRSALQGGGLDSGAQARPEEAPLAAGAQCCSRCFIRMVYLAISNVPRGVLSLFESGGGRACSPGKQRSPEKKKKTSAAPDDTGSWIYILGNSSSSVRAKKLATMMQPETFADMPI
ncbi:hypothetical protein CYMTET_33424, partial [Cymbomonas tetramitiformis]